MRLRRTAGWTSRVVTWALAGLVAGLAGGCGVSKDGEFAAASRAPDAGFAPGVAADGGTKAGGGGQSDFVPEEEEEFTFSRPVVVDQSLFVANRTLNSVAVVDSSTLSIDTVLVGFKPTVVAGPDEAHSDSDDARVMVLNEGSDSVTVIDPGSLETTTHSVMRGPNRLEVDPTGRYGIVWYDRTRDEDGGEAGGDTGDLSAVTVVTAESTHRISVGFNVRDVFYDRRGERALVLTDKGVSVIDLTALDGDAVARPISIVPPFLESLNPSDLEVRVTRDAKYVVTRSAGIRGLVLLDVLDEKRYVVPAPTIPTDLDLTGGDERGIVAMLRGTSQAVRVDVPSGFVAMANRLDVDRDRIRVGSDEEDGEPSGAGSLVAAPRGADASADTESHDAGIRRADASTTDTTRATSDTLDDTSGDAGDTAPPPDATARADTSMRDANVTPRDATASDAGGDAAADDASTPPERDTIAPDAEGDVTAPDTSDARHVDGGSTDAGDSGFFPSDVEGVQVFDIDVPALGSATVGGRGTRALLYAARGGDAEDLEPRVVLLTFADGSQSTIALEKGVRGAVSGEAGETFVVYNTKQPGSLPDDATPGDPTFIARSWGVTLIDVASSTGQLQLTEAEPGPTTLWRRADNPSKLYLAFKRADDRQRRRTTTTDVVLRNVVEFNLETFRKRTHRMPSVPTALGPIRPAGKVFINQKHPEGRMTFIDVETSERQTITGYQLNSKIR